MFFRKVYTDRSFYRFVTIHTCDRRTGGQTVRIILIARPRLHSMQRGTKRVAITNTASLTTSGLWTNLPNLYSGHYQHLMTFFTFFQTIIHNWSVPPAANKHTFLQMHLFPTLPFFQALCHVFILQCLNTYSGQTCFPLGFLFLPHCVSKNIPDVFSYNSRYYWRIFTIFGRNVTEKESNICCYIFLPHLINASTLPCVTENTEIVSFHVNVACWFANRHKSYIRIVT